MTIRQTLTEGGSLYGYTPTDLLPHVRESHDLDAVWTERRHLAAHEAGCDHEHYVTETGALALLVRR